MISEKQYRDAAIKKYERGSDNNIEIDEDIFGSVSKGEDGAFVKAWVWVSNEDAEKES